MSKSKIVICTLVSLFTVAVLICTISFINPIRRPQKLVEKYVLKEVPLGTSMVDAIDMVEDKSEWRINYVSKESGYCINQYGDADPYSDLDDVCAKYIEVHLGTYRGVFDCDVIAFLGFDEEDNLIIVTVNKQYDSL